MDEANVQAAEVRVLVNMLQKLAAQDLERRLAACGVEISALQYGVLRRLSRASATLSELGAGMMLAPATLVPVVDALESKRLVQRDLDVLDRRRKSLTLMPAGAQLLQRLPLLAQDDELAQAMAAIGEDDARQLIDLLGRVVTRLSHDPELAPRVLGHIRAAHSQP